MNKDAYSHSSCWQIYRYPKGDLCGDEDKLHTTEDKAGKSGKEKEKRADSEKEKGSRTLLLTWIDV